MTSNTLRKLFGCTFAVGLAWAACGVREVPVEGSDPTESSPVAKASASPSSSPAPRPTIDEARARAALLHETMHATLQIVHHRYYREDEGLAIPAATLKEVFRQVADESQVQMRWLAVTGKAMSVDHNPQDEFEKNAAQALASGKKAYEQAAGGVYRRVGLIKLGSECIKCHVPNRTSTEDRAAGLIISMAVESH